MRRFAVRFAALSLAFVPPPAFAITELSVSADYCAIYRALTGTTDPKCPDPAFDAPTRTVNSAHDAVPPGSVSDERGYFIRFAFNSEVLTPAYQEHLNRLKDVLASAENSELCLKLVGHTDSIGSPAYNQELSERRARSVMLYLVGPLEVSEDRISTEGRGESQGLVGLPGPDARNRRVEVLAKASEDGCAA